MAAAGDLRVILGMAGAWADDNDGDSSCSSDHYTCKIGGFPDWPPPFGHELQNLLLCKMCQNTPLSLLAQVYAPISTPSFNIPERLLYIFGCASHPLSWRVLRLQNNQLQHPPPTNASTSQLHAPSSPSSVPAKNWWDFDDDDDDDDDVVDLKELGKAFSQAALSSPPTPNKHTTNNTKSKAEPSPPKIKLSTSLPRDKPVVPCFYIYTQDEEPSSTKLASARSNCSLLSVKNNQIDNDDDQGEDEKWEGESYEYDRALNADRTYLKFKKRMDANPEQCFRYSYGGEPLLATAGSIEEPEMCKRCGEKRHYEMQLMPQVLYFIQQEQAKDSSAKHSLENWNWMTLIVFTCSKSCSQLLKHESDHNGWVVAEEAVLLQFE